jgi:hypothetical protein
MHEHNRAHVAAFQAVGCQVACEGDCVEFLDYVHDFRSGCRESRRIGSAQTSPALWRRG